MYPSACLGKKKKKKTPPQLALKVDAHSGRKEQKAENVASVLAPFFSGEPRTDKKPTISHTCSDLKQLYIFMFTFPNKSDTLDFIFIFFCKIYLLNYVSSCALW